MKETRPILLSVALMAVSVLPAMGLQFTMEGADPAMVDHWPSADGLIGTLDDHVSGNCSPQNCSGPNVNGSYSYGAFDFGVGGTDTGMPTGFQAITFVEGTVGIDITVANNGGGPLLTAMVVTGTEPFFGHGAYSSNFSSINGGTYDPVSKAITMNVDFQAVLGGPPDTALNFEMTGTAWVIVEADYGILTHEPYLDEVVIPRAIARGASRLVFVRLSGNIPAAEGGSWPEMPMTGAFLAFTDATATEETSWSEVKSAY